MYTPERRTWPRALDPFGFRNTCGFRTNTCGVSSVPVCLDETLVCYPLCESHATKQYGPILWSGHSFARSPHTTHDKAVFAQNRGSVSDDSGQCRGPQRAGAAKNRVVSAANTYPDAHLKTHASLITASKVGTAIALVCVATVSRLCLLGLVLARILALPRAVSPPKVTGDLATAPGLFAPLYKYRVESKDIHAAGCIRGA